MVFSGDLVILRGIYFLLGVSPFTRGFAFRQGFRLSPEVLFSARGFRISPFMKMVVNNDSDDYKIKDDPTTNDSDDYKIKEESKKERITIVLNEKDLTESFVKGSGNGGQKINKTSNCVDLRHVPTGIRVVCQQTRSLQQNRSIARKLMIEKLDDYYNGDQSKSAIKREIAKKREAKRRKRAREKYGITKSKEETSIE